MSVISSAKRNAHTRVRSASSPPKALVAPAADVPLFLESVVDESCLLDKDGSMETFVNGVDKLHGVFKNGLLVCLIFSNDRLNLRL